MTTTAGDCCPEGYPKSLSEYSSLRSKNLSTNGYLISSSEVDGFQYVPFHSWVTAGLKKDVQSCHPYPNKSFSLLLPKCWKALAVSWRPRAVRSK